MKKILTLSLILFGIMFTIVGWVLVERNTPSDIELKAQFIESPLQIPTYELYDVGVADVDSDGNYDLFSLNHSARQVVLINDGTGEFEDKINELGLSQDLGFPDLENRGTDASFEKSGFYVYRKNKNLHLRSFNSNQTVSGEVSFPWPLTVVKSQDAEFTLSVSEKYNSTIKDSKLSFSIGSGGEIVVLGDQKILELEHIVELDSNFPLKSVFLGHSLLNPVEHVFTMEWRDRHAMSWVDVNGDGELDVFISRGGVKGQLDRVPVKVTDRLMINRNGNFVDKSQEYSLEKYGCPARQTAWVDYDNNGLLDIHISCGRNRLPGFSNVLLSQKAMGEFTNTATTAELDFEKISVFKWFDSDRDGDIDLLSIDDTQLVHYVNNSGVFAKKVLIDGLTTDFVQIQVSDFDSDGDFDAYAMSRSESKLIVNDDGLLRAVDPRSYGLPAGGRSAEWIDFDNDGIVDFHAVPGGLFSQAPSGQFEKTGLLDTNEDIFKISQSRCNWFDFDNNGSLDAVCAIQRNYAKELRILKKLFDRNALTRYWDVAKYVNAGNSNNWLHVNLVGSKGNRQAIGAIVEITANDVTQIRSTGSTDGAHYSQGNYRSYFGLGDVPTVDLVRVYWSDGDISEIRNVDVNRVIDIDKSDLY